MTTGFIIVHLDNSDIQHWMHDVSALHPDIDHEGLQITLPDFEGKASEIMDLFIDTLFEQARTDIPPYYARRIASAMEDEGYIDNQIIGFSFTSIEHFVLFQFEL